MRRPRSLPPGQSEADYAGLTLEPSAKVRPPRVAESPVHLECQVRQIMSIGDGPDRGQPGDRRGALDSHRRLRARRSWRRRSAQAAHDRPAGGRLLLPEHRPVRDGTAVSRGLPVVAGARDPRRPHRGQPQRRAHVRATPANRDQKGFTALAPRRIRRARVRDHTLLKDPLCRPRSHSSTPPSKSRRSPRWR